MRADLVSPVHTLKISNVLIGVFEEWRLKLFLITLLYCRTVLDSFLKFAKAVQRFTTSCHMPNNRQTSADSLP